jgi:hypothetical protein|tara:strand:+ start:4082 stop:5323 length:1242 start_codon:yes stop_codon:yes gene_type:complete
MADTYGGYPKAARAAARRALKHKADKGSSCGTPVGWERANQIASGEKLSLTTIKRTFSFLSRAGVYNQGKFYDEDGKEICGSVMYAAWGGTSMRNWCSGIINKSKRSAEEARNITATVKKTLEGKVKDHNEGNPKHKATYGMLAACFRRGIGAYKTNPESVRPSVKSPEQWAFARVNAFLYALRNEKFKGGKFDTDLLPSSHPLSSKKKSEKKSDTMNDFERRCGDIQFRDEDEGRVVTGYAAVFDESTRIGEVDEVISRDAFSDSLNDDVVALFNHDMNMVLARSTGGEGTLRMEIDEKGLKYTFRLGNQTYARDLEESIARGDIKGSSFAFTVREDQYERQDNGRYLRRIEKIGRLIDVSVVSVPAYPQTSVAMRDMIGALEAQSQEEIPTSKAHLVKLAEAQLSIHKLKS